MKQIYEHKRDLNELAYKDDVRTYKEAHFVTGNQMFKNLGIVKESGK